MPMILPRYMTAMRSASSTTSSSSVDTMITGVPLSRSWTILRCRNSIEPTSTPRVGWLAMNSLSGRGELAGEHDLLLVATREASDVLAGTLRADVELVDALLGVLADRCEVECDALGVGRLVVEVEHEVLGDGEVEDEPVDLAVLGDEADACAEHLVGAEPVIERPSRVMVPAELGTSPRIASDSSVWPLPWTPAIATISPCATSKDTSSTTA